MTLRSPAADVVACGLEHAACSQPRLRRQRRPRGTGLRAPGRNPAAAGAGPPVPTLGPARLRGRTGTSQPKGTDGRTDTSLARSERGRPRRFGRGCEECRARLSARGKQPWSSAGLWSTEEQAKTLGGYPSPGEEGQPPSSSPSPARAGHGRASALAAQRTGPAPSRGSANAAHSWHKKEAMQPTLQQKQLTFLSQSNLFAVTDFHAQDYYK